MFGNHKVRRRRLSDLLGGELCRIMARIGMKKKLRTMAGTIPHQMETKTKSSSNKLLIKSKTRTSNRKREKETVMMWIMIWGRLRKLGIRRR